MKTWLGIFHNVGDPKPSVYLVVNTLILIFGCTAIIAVGVADIAFGPAEDARSQFFGMCCTLPLNILFIIVQYLAVFRRNKRAAAIATCLLFFFGALDAVGAFIVGLHLVWQEGLAPVVLIPVTILAFSLYLFLSAFLNLRWWQRLKLGK